MLVLYRCGRQREALELYRDVRRAAIADSGIEPWPNLRRLQDAILRQDPSLDLAEPPELPAELDPALNQRLVRRDIELAWLKERWGAVRADGRGRIVSIVAARGSGKTRLAAELARAVNRRGFRVLYGTSDSASAAIAAALEATEPTLLVLDDVKPPDVGDVRHRARARRSSPARRPGRAATRSTSRRSIARPSTRSRASTRQRPTSRTRRRGAARASGGIAARRPPARRAVGARTSPRDASGGRPAGRRRAGPSCTRSSRSWPATSPRSRRSPPAPPRPRSRRRGPLPVQGPGVVRGRRRAVLLRPRAAGRRPRRSPGRRAAARGRRRLGQRQVVGRHGGAAAGAGRAASCPAATGWAQQVVSARASSRCARWRRRGAARSRPLRARGRPVRGDVHDLPRRGASEPRSSPRSSSWPRTRAGRGIVVLAIRADHYGRCAEYARARAPARPPTGARRRRWTATSCAAPSSGPPSARACTSSRGSPTRWSTTSTSSPGRCRCSRRRCWSSGSTAPAAA